MLPWIFIRVAFLTMPLSRRYCVPFIGFLSQMHSSSLRCAVLGAGDRCEWFHRMPQLIFRLYHAIWDCFTDIQELLHLGNEKKNCSLFNWSQWKHSVGQRCWFVSKSHSWTSCAESMAFYSPSISARTRALCGLREWQGWPLCLFVQHMGPLLAHDAPSHTWFLEFG